MLVTINGVDLTPLIDEKSYKMNTEDTYESWLDGNYVEHRIYTRNKVKGSFNICLYGQTVNNTVMTTSAFLNLWNAAVDNHKATLGVFVQNMNSFEAIEAFYHFEGTFHREMINGSWCDKLTVSITER